MAPTIEQEREFLQVLRVYHDAVVHVPGLENRDRAGRLIKPLGLKLAGDLAGLSKSDMSNRLNPNMPEHRPTLEGFFMHLQAGMDLAPLDEIERSLGRVSFTLPDVEAHKNLAVDLAKAGREFGDVCQSMADALIDGKITRKEFAAFSKETDEAIAALAELREAMRQEVK